MARTYEDAKTDYERNIIQNIEEHGWACTCVFDPEEQNPSFAYSIGFTETLNVPEFIAFGLSTNLMQSMLWEVYRQIRDGKTPEDGLTWNGLIANYECVSRKVHPSNIVRDYLNSAIWFWGETKEKGPLEAFQIVWPSNGPGLFPWDEDCSQIVRDAQPPLYLPNRGLS